MTSQFSDLIIAEAAIAASPPTAKKVLNIRRRVERSLYELEACLAQLNTIVEDNDFNADDTLAINSTIAQFLNGGAPYIDVTDATRAGVVNRGDFDKDGNRIPYTGILALTAEAQAIIE